MSHPDAIKYIPIIDGIFLLRVDMENKGESFEYNISNLGKGFHKIRFKFVFEDDTVSGPTKQICLLWSEDWTNNAMVDQQNADIRGMILVSEISCSEEIKLMPE
jgi:hypothetical protein